MTRKRAMELQAMRPWAGAVVLALACACGDGGTSGDPATTSSGGSAQGGDDAGPVVDVPDAAVDGPHDSDFIMVPERPFWTAEARDGGGEGDAAIVIGLPDAGIIDGCEGADIPPGPRATRLMTREEYNNTLRDLLADTTRPASTFPPENAVLGFENNADAHTMNPALLEKLMTAAEDVAHRAVSENLAMILACDPAVVGEPVCGELFIRRFTRQAFRRPVTETEVQGFLALFTAQRGLYGFEMALELVIQAVLQSPQFLYRIESTPDGITARHTVDGYVMASRLSYFLWNSMPDETLFAEAEAGRLLTRDDVELQARRMLNDGRAREAVRGFHRQWLHLDGLKIASKDPNVYSAFTDELRTSWAESVYKFVDDVFWNGDATLDTLLTAPTFFVDNAMAPIYGAATPPSGNWVKVTRDGERAGLLTQPGLLALLAAPNQSSPIRRGLFVREKLMCEPPRSPPPGANFSPPDVDPNSTTRERFAQHTSSSGCQACHIFIDPVGFGFERFDGIGRYRATEAGRDVDDSGEIVGASDIALEGPYHGVVELAAKLAGSAQVEECVVRQHMRAAFGRADVAGDACTTRQLHAIFRMTGGNLRELLVAIATHEAFRTADAAPEGGTP